MGLASLSEEEEARPHSPPWEGTARSCHAYARKSPPQNLPCQHQPGRQVSADVTHTLLLFQPLSLWCLLQEPELTEGAEAVPSPLAVCIGQRPGCEGACGVQWEAAGLHADSWKPLPHPLGDSTEGRARLPSLGRCSWSQHQATPTAPAKLRPRLSPGTFSAPCFENH